MKSNKQPASLLSEQFLDAVWLESGLSENTLNAYRNDLAAFEGWLGKKNLSLEAVSRAELLSYLAANVRQGLSPRSSARRLSTLRRFYRYLLREGLIQEDPTADVRSPSLGRPLPKAITEASVEKLLAAPPETTLGLRDRAMLETMYACGLRVSELVALALNEQQGLSALPAKAAKSVLCPWATRRQPDLANIFKAPGLRCSVSRKAVRYF